MKHLPFRTLATLALVLGCYARAASAEQPTPAVAELFPGRTQFDGSVTRWFTPQQANGPGADLGFSRPTTQVTLAGWRGPWGSRVSATLFGQTDLPGQGPYIPAFGWFGDLQLRRRWQDDRWALNAGVRLLGFKHVGYGTLGLSFHHPLADWLDVDADALAGTNVNLAYVLDGQASLRAHHERWGLSLGLRALDLQCGCVPPEPSLWLVAPTLGLTAAF